MTQRCLNSEPNCRPKNLWSFTVLSCSRSLCLFHFGFRMSDCNLFLIISGYIFWNVKWLSYQQKFNELYIVTLKWPLWARNTTSLPELEALQVKAERPFSKPICAKEERNGLPSVNESHSDTAHTVCTLWHHTHLPLPRPVLLPQNLSPKDIARSDVRSWKFHGANVCQ